MTAKAHPKNALSATFVSKTRQPGRYADGHGLYLVIEPSGSRRWEQRLQIRGKRRTLGLGGYPLVTLAMAREAALENKRQARAGHDPLTVKRRAGIANGIPTFAEATAIVFDLRRPGWRSARHAQQWIESLNEYAIDAVRASNASPSARLALEFMVLTAARSGEVTGHPSGGNGEIAPGAGRGGHWLSKCTTKPAIASCVPMSAAA